MTAQGAASRAAARAPSVKGQARELERARSTVTAAGIGLVPRIEAAASYTRLSDIDQPPLNFGGMTVANPFPVILDQYALQASVRVPVSAIFLSLLPAYQASEAAEQMAGYQLEAERQNAALRARIAFYDMVESRAAAMVAEDRVRLFELNVADVEALQQAGVVTIADAQQMKAYLASARVGFEHARATAATRVASLRQLVDGDVSKDAPAIGEDLFALEAPALASRGQALKTALSDRPELQALRAVIEVREAEHRAQYAQGLPRLDVVGTVLYANPNQRILPQAQEFNATWQVGATLSWSPNDAIMGVHQVSAKDELVLKAQYDLQQLEEAVTVETTGALNSYEAARAAIEASNEGLEAATTTYRVRKDLLDAGEATASEFLEAEVDLRRAQLEHISAHLAVRRARTQLDYVLGRALGQALTPDRAQAQK